MQVSAKILILLAFPIAVSVGASCSPSDDTSASSTDAGRDGGVIPDPDTIPPEIRFRVPADGEDGVSVRTPIRVVFSEPVKLGDPPLTLTANEMTIPISASLSEDRTVMTVTPTAELPVPAKLSVQFANITDIRGNALIRPPWSWSAPLWLKVGDPFQNPGTPKVLELSAGPGEQVRALLKLSPDEPYLTFRSISHPAGAWSRLQEPFSEQSGRRPKLFLNKDGSLIVANGPETDTVLVSRFDGSVRTKIGEPLQRDFNDFDLTSSPTGVICLTYGLPLNENQSNIVVKTRAPSDTIWSTLGTTVNDPATEKESRVQSIAIDKIGNRYIGYINGYSGFVRTWSGTAWNLVAGALNRDDEEVLDLSIAVNDISELFALVVLSNRFVTEVRTRIFRYDGTKWIGVGTEVANATASHPISFAGTKNGHLFIQGAADALQLLDVTRDGWTTISPPHVTSPPSMAGTAAIDPTGVPVIAWTDEANDVHVMRLNR